MLEGTFRALPGAGAQLCLAVLATVLLAGCNTSKSSEPTELSRTTLNTAPADLQLSCAAAAATQFGVDSNTILPVSSSPVDSHRYLVQLDMRGQRSTCIIDTNGTVISVQAA